MKNLPLPLAGFALALSTMISTAGLPLAFTPAGANEFAFNTGVLRGKLHAEGKSKGLSDVEYLPAGTVLDRSMGLVGHYRVFSAGKRYGNGAWDWPSQATLRSDGTVEVRWPAAPDRPFDLSAVYRWAAPNALDVTTTVQARTNLVRFESFLASYFSEGFTNSRVYVQKSPENGGTKGFLPAKAGAGAWQAFARDAAAETIVHDGRWSLPPNPVDWVLMPRLQKPLGVRQAPANGLSAILMSPPDDCFAICTPEQNESHRSMYLSLFGQDLAAGQTARARARLVISSEVSEREMERLYEGFTRETN
jgi:hypothetical protein